MGVAASGVWGCSLWHVELQPGLEPSAHMLPGAEVASNSARANGGAPAGCTTTQNSMPAELLGLLCTAAAACRQVGTVAPGARYALSAPKRTAARPLSAACRSFRPTLGRAIIFRSGLEAGMSFSGPRTLKRHPVPAPRSTTAIVAVDFAASVIVAQRSTRPDAMRPRSSSTMRTGRRTSSSAQLRFRASASRVDVRRTSRPSPAPRPCRWSVSR